MFFETLKLGIFETLNIDFLTKKQDIWKIKNGKIIYLSRSVDCAIFLPENNCFQENIFQYFKKIMIFFSVEFNFL